MSKFIRLETLTSPTAPTAWETSTPRTDDLYDLCPLDDLDLPFRADIFLTCKIKLTLPGWEPYDLHDLLH